MTNENNNPTPTPALAQVDNQILIADLRQALAALQVTQPLLGSMAFDQLYELERRLVGPRPLSVDEQRLESLKKDAGRVRLKMSGDYLHRALHDQVVAHMQAEIDALRAVPAPTEWGCEARQKLAVARGTIDELMEALSPNGPLYKMAKQRMDETAMPHVNCTTSTPAVEVCNELNCDPKNGNLRCLRPKGHTGPGDAWANPEASNEADEEQSQMVQALCDVVDFEATSPKDDSPRSKAFARAANIAEAVLRNTAPMPSCCGLFRGHLATCPRVLDGTLLETSHRACGGRGCTSCMGTGHEPPINPKSATRSAPATIILALLKRVGGKATFTLNELARAHQAQLAERFDGHVLELSSKTDT